MTRQVGSVKRGIVASELQEERAKCSFDQSELQVFLHGGQDKFNVHKDILDKFGADPIITNKLEFTDMTVHEMQEDLWKRNN